jgi:hypothetical protein
LGDPILIISYTKNRAGRVAQMIECLPSKCEALNSNPLPQKKRTYLEMKRRVMNVGSLLHPHLRNNNSHEKIIGFLLHTRHGAIIISFYPFCS